MWVFFRLTLDFSKGESTIYRLLFFFAKVLLHRFALPPVSLFSLTLFPKSGIFLFVSYYCKVHQKTVLVSFFCRYCEFKMTYYSSVSFLYLGIGSEESQKMGERIAYFEKAAELLIASGKLTKNLDSDVVRKSI